jgi:glycosyltransferase involved in cell wall biosynthesis
MRALLIALSLLYSSFLHSSDEGLAPEILVVIPSYNNAQWVEGNLSSLCEQTWTGWHAVYINDCSQDNTGALAAAFIRAHHLEQKITLINNPERKGALYNTYTAIHQADPNWVIVMLDGDDKFLDPRALEIIATIYQSNPEIWLTWGNYISAPIPLRGVCREFPRWVIKKNSFRKYKFITGHIRTFYAGLFQLIKKEDLMKDGSFLPSAGDVATMLPMLEMASRGHFYFINKVLYEYNDANPINDFRRRAIQRSCSLYVRSLPPYAPLERATWRN